MGKWSERHTLSPSQRWDHPSSFEGIKLHTLLASGSFGDVYLGSNHVGKHFAVKIESTQSQRPQLQREYQFLDVSSLMFAGDPEGLAAEW
jgi:predicted Ser/Thr protein kinase